MFEAKNLETTAQSISKIYETIAFETTIKY